MIDVLFLGKSTCMFPEIKHISIQMHIMPLRIDYFHLSSFSLYLSLTKKIWKKFVKWGELNWIECLWHILTSWYTTYNSWSKINLSMKGLKLFSINTKYQRVNLFNESDLKIHLYGLISIFRPCQVTHRFFCF